MDELRKNKKKNFLLVKLNKTVKPSDPANQREKVFLLPLFI